MAAFIEAQPGYARAAVETMDDRIFTVAEVVERVSLEYSVDPRAKLAAFTIGRIRDEQFRDLAAAADSYEKAVETHSG